MVSMSDAEAILQILSAPDATEGLGAPEIRGRLQQRGIPLSQPTLSRRLSELQRRGQIVRQGLRRGTRYALDPVALHFSIASERRKPVNYNFALILEYRPNVTQWLSAPQREGLRAAGERIRALPPAQGNTVLERLAIDLSWASSYLEGNTYSLLDTERLLVEGRAAAGHSAQETRMILNHKAALDYLREHAASFGPNQQEIRELHSLLANGLLANEADAGRIRRGIVEIGGSAYLPVTPPQQLEEQLNLILEKAREIEDPFEQSVFLLAFIPYLQPFIDVNKRVGRLAANIPLLKANVCPMSYRDMDKERYTRGLLAFYELNRPEILARAYADAYERGVDRYSAIVEQGREVNPLEIQYLRELKQCVADYIGELADGREAGHPAAFARTRFSMLPDAQREWLAERVAEVVLALHEGNIIAWGVHRETWRRYAVRVQR
jgi:Fic family protein